MLCENCGKKNVTSIFLPPNEKKLKYLCGECYKKLNSDLELEKFAYSYIKSIKIDSKCNNCGTTFGEFEKSGLFGCSECYNAFKEYINNNVLNLVKEPKFLGKKPNMYYIESEIKNLETMIEICLKNGDLNRATKYGKELDDLKESCYGRL